MNVNLTSVTATWMQTVLTHMVLTNAHVKWDTSAMDAHVQVVLIFSYITSFCWSSHNFMQRYPCMFMQRVTTIYIFCYTFCNDKRNYMTMGHKNDKVKNLSIVSQIFTSVKEITLVTWMLHARTPKDRMFVLVTPEWNGSDCTGT